MAGKVYLVGAGPGDPELLTLKALRVLRIADIVLHDSLVGREILALAPRTAKVLDVGKRCGRKSLGQEEINKLLVSYALLDLRVVRLKGGDPLIFGRAGEEIEALRNAGIEFEIIPGVTAALGAAATAQIPLTHRRLSSALTLVTNHHANEADAEEWTPLTPSGGTLAIYMPGHDYAVTAKKLLGSGLRGTTPCVIISHATSQNQQIHKTSIEDLPLSPHLPAPTLLLVGEVAGLAQATQAQADELIPSETHTDFLVEQPLRNQELAE